VTGLARATVSSVAALLCACTPPAPAGPMTFGVLNAACTEERIVAERAAGVTVVELPLAWDRYEPEPGQVDTAYVAEVHRKIDTCRAADMRVVLGLGLQYPPDWVRALPDAVLRGSAGNTPGHGGLDLVFNAAVRDAASAYIGRLAADLSLASSVSGVSAVRVGVSGTGELAYPGPDAAVAAEAQPMEEEPADPGTAGEDPDVADPGLSTHEWWAFGAAPQTGAGLADGASVSPLPGWVPGQPEWRGAAVTTDQADAWLGWYTTSLVDTVVWQVGRLRELGYPGDVHVPLAGRGILPADRAAAVDGLLDGRADPDGALERGLDYPSQFPVLAGLDRVVVDFTGLDDVQAVTARERGQDRCLPDDTDDLLDRTDTADWPGQRFTSALARHTGLAIVGENPGPPDAPHTGGDPASDTSAQQLQRAPDYARECGMTEFWFAFEDDLFTPGSGVDLTAYAQRIAGGSA